MGNWTTNSFLYQPTLGAQGQAEHTLVGTGQELVDTRLANEVWVGDPIFEDASTYSNYQKLANAISKLTTLTRLRLPTGIYTLTESLDCGEYAVICQEPGAMIAIPDGFQLTIQHDGPNGAWQRFDDQNTGLDGVVFGAGAVTDVYPKWWGTNTTPGTTDMTDAVQAAINATVHNRGRVDLGNETYKITSNVKWWVDCCQIVGNKAVLDFSSMTSGNAITATSYYFDQIYEDNSWQMTYNNAAIYMDGIILQGPLDSATVWTSSPPEDTPDCLVINNIAESTQFPMFATLRSVVIHGFRRGIECQNHTGMWSLLACNIYRCYDSFYFDTVTTSYVNAGERITILGGMIFNGYRAFNLNMISFELNVFGISIDGMHQVAKLDNASRLYLNNCHLENGEIDETMPFFQVGYKSELSVNGSYVFDRGSGGSRTREYIVKFDNDGYSATNYGTAIFNDCNLWYLQPTSGFFADINDATDRISITNSPIEASNENVFKLCELAYYDNLCCIDGGFELLSTLDDNWFINNESGHMPITSKTSGTDVSLSISTTYANTGTHSLKIIAVSDAQFALAIPCNTGAFRCEFYSKLASAITSGTMVISSGYGIVGVNVNGIPSIIRLVEKSTENVDLSTGFDWTQNLHTTLQTTSPAWATHFILSFGFGTLVGGPVSIYLDDFYIHKQ